MQLVFGGEPQALAEVVAEPIRLRLQVAEGLGVGLLGRGVGAARGERHLDGDARVRGGLLHAGVAREDDQVGQGDLLAAGRGAVEGLPDTLQGAQHRGELVGVIDLPAALRLEADPRAVGAAALVAAAERRGRRPRGGDELGDGQAGGEDLPLEPGDVVGADQFVVHRRHRVLPDQLLRRNLGAEVADPRAHVAVGQLEPGAGERVGEGLLVVLEAPGNRLVDRVEAQRQVGGEHPRLALAVAVRVGHQAGAAVVLGPPLLGPRRGLELLPFVAEQDVEELVVPPGRVVGPGDLEPAGDRVARPCRCRRSTSSRNPGPRTGRPRGRGRRSPPGPRRGSCRRCARRRSAPPSPRRSWPSGRTSRGCRRAAARKSPLPFGPSGLT